jgi:hypothetical protein
MLESLSLTWGQLAGLVMVASTLAAFRIPDGTGRRRAFAGVLVLALALATMHWLAERSGAESLTAAGTAQAVATVLAIAAVGAGLTWLVRGMSRTVLQWIGGGSLAPSVVTGEAAWDAWSSRLFALHLVTTLLALAAPHLHSLMGAVTIAALSGLVLERRTGPSGRLPVVLPLAVLALGYLWYTLARVAGPMPVGFLALRDAPYSEAFETMMALPLALVAWCLLGLWPFHGVSRGPLTGLLGAAVLVKLVAPVLPHGLAHWQPLLYLLCVLAAWHAAKAPRGEALSTILAALGLLSGSIPAGWAAFGLLTVAMLLAARPRLAALGLTPNRRGVLLSRATTIAAASLLPTVLQGGLGAEMIYTALVVGGVVLGTGNGEQGTGNRERGTGNGKSRLDQHRLASEPPVLPFSRSPVLPFPAFDPHRTRRHICDARAGISG